MSLEFSCAAIANRCLPHSGPQAAVHVVLAGSLFNGGRGGYFLAVAPNGENLRYELAATRCL